MDSVILSTAYFPPVQYFSMLIRSSEVIVENDENFLKQTYRNRCTILGANGPLNLSIPVQHPEPKIKISGLQISYHQNWQLLHYRAIESAYRNSPFFEFYIDDLKHFFEEKPSSLLEYNTRILKTCLELIRHKCEIKFTGSFSGEQPSNDYRYRISPKIENSGYIFPEYHQVFSGKFGFIPNLSVLDLLFNLGPDTKDYLQLTQKRNGQI